MVNAIIDELHPALMDLVNALTRPQLDERILGEAGVTLDRALFPLIVRIGLYGPVSVVDLAAMVGRDPSTVSRQVSKLEAHRLIERNPGGRDQRVREAVTTEAGREMIKAIGRARKKVFGELMIDWNPTDQRELARLVRKLADEMAGRRF